MKHKINKLISASKRKLIKVRLDARTVITISNMASLQAWKIRYPEARVVNN